MLFLSKYDKFGYSKFFIYEGKSSYKTRIGGIISIIIIASIIGYILKSVFSIISDINEPEVGYSKEWDQNSYLNLTTFPIVIKIKQVAFDERIDLESGITITAFLKNSNVFMKSIPVVHCRSLNLSQYDERIGKTVTELIDTYEDERSTFYCLNTTSASKLNGINFMNMDPNQFLTVSVSFCKKLGSFKNQRACDESIESKTGITINTYVFSDILHLKSLKSTPLTRFTKENLVKFESFLVDSEQINKMSICLKRVNITSSKGYFVIRETKASAVIIDQIASDLPHIYPLNLSGKGFAFTVILKGEVDLFERSFLNFVECFAKIGGLLKFFKTIVFIFHSLYSRLFYSDLIKKFEFTNLENKEESIIHNISLRKSDLGVENLNLNLIESKLILVQTADKEIQVKPKSTCCKIFKCKSNRKDFLLYKNILKSKLDIINYLKFMFEYEKMKFEFCKEKGKERDEIFPKFSKFEKNNQELNDKYMFSINSITPTFNKEFLNTDIDVSKQCT